MKKLLCASVFTLAGLTTAIDSSFADINEQMKNSKYCETNSADVVCMGPESQALRAQMLAMTKETAIENRTKYCREHATPDDPICDPKVMNDTTGY